MIVMITTMDDTVYDIRYILTTTQIFIKILFSSWFDWQLSFLQI